jgi:UDP-glucose 4-epimerase
MRYIVTGGCGFIGSHIVDKLTEENNEVIVIDNVSSSSRDEYFFNKKATYYDYDLCDYDFIVSLFENIDCVFHLAAEISIPYCIENPNQSMRNNTISTLNVLEAARNQNVKRVIFSSTCAVYGNKFFLPSYETNPTQPLNTYSLSKQSGEELCKLYYHLYGLETIVLRYFNVYGDRQPSKGSYAPVMAIFLRQKNNNEPLTLFGDGFQTRDFVNVYDVVDANLLSSKVNLTSYGEIFNVGTGIGISIKEVADLISTDQIYLPERPGEVIHSRANIDKIRKIGWKPKVDLKQWIKNQL